VDPFIGEIKMFSYGWAPQGWALCNGGQLTIQQNQALYSLIQSTYGGDNKTVFNLPDMRGQVPLGYGQSPVSGTFYQMNNKGGAETVSLTQAQTPQHIHATNVVNSAANAALAQNNLPAIIAPVAPNPTIPIYAVKGSNAAVPLAPTTVQSSGAGAPHTNMQPWAVTNYCIAVSGTYPSRQ
jgi:microcystin-dependent protein